MSRRSPSAALTRSITNSLSWLCDAVTSLCDAATLIASLRGSVFAASANMSGVGGGARGRAACGRSNLVAWVSTAHTCGERGAKFMKQSRRVREERRRKPPREPAVAGSGIASIVDGEEKPVARERVAAAQLDRRGGAPQRPQAAFKAAGRCRRRRRRRRRRRSAPARCACGSTSRGRVETHIGTVTKTEKVGDACSS